MKKYILLVFLVACSATLAYYSYYHAHTNTELVSLNFEEDSVKTAEIKQGENYISTASKDFFGTVTEKVTKSLFTLIYK